MSAFMVSERTMHRVIYGMVENGVIPAEEGTPEGRRFYRMNVDAMRARYPKENYPLDLALSYTYSRSLGHCSNIEALKAVNCLLYQCMEGDVPRSDLYQYLESVLTKLAFAIACALPEYKEAAWDA